MAGGPQGFGHCRQGPLHRGVQSVWLAATKSCGPVQIRKIPTYYKPTGKILSINTFANIVELN